MAFIDNLQAKWESITPRERMMVGLLGVALPVVLLLWGGGKIADGLAAREAHNNQMRKALNVLADLRTRGAPAPVDTTLQNMPAQPANLESYLDAAGKKQSITIPRYSPGTPITKNGFVTHSTGIEVNDVTLEQLTGFLKEVESSKYVAVTSLKTNRDFRDSNKVDARLEVAAYAKEPTAAPAAEGSGNAGGSATEAAAPAAGPGKVQ